MNQDLWNRFFKVSLASMALLGGLSAAMGSWRVSSGLLAGMALMTANLFLLRRTVEWFLSGKRMGALGSSALLVGKFGFLLAATWGILGWTEAHPAAFGAGVVAVPLILGFSRAGRPEAGKAHP